ncbi:MAG: hypothetical protein WCD72_08820 [Dehalococcoidia bacterium]
MRYLGRYVYLPEPFEVANEIRAKCGLNEDKQIDALGVQRLLTGFGATKHWVEPNKKEELVNTYCRSNGITWTDKARRRLLGAPEITLGTHIHLDRAQVHEGSPREQSLLVHALVHIHLNLPSIPGPALAYTKSALHLRAAGRRNESYVNRVTNLLMLPQREVIRSCSFMDIKQVARRFGVPLYDFILTLPDLLGIPLLAIRYVVFEPDDKDNCLVHLSSNPHWHLGGGYDASVGTLAAILVNEIKEEEMRQQLSQFAWSLASGPRRNRRVGLSWEVGKSTIVMNASFERSSPFNSKIRRQEGFLTILVAPVQAVIRRNYINLFSGTKKEITSAALAQPSLVDVVRKQFDRRKPADRHGSLTVLAAPVNASKTTLLRSIAQREGQGAHTTITFGEDKIGPGEIQRYEITRIPAFMSPESDIVLIDNAHLAIGDVENVCVGLTWHGGKDVFVAGLDTDTSGNPIIHMGQLMCQAKKILKTDPTCEQLLAYCETPECRRARVPASRTAIVDASSQDGTSIASLQSLCRKCFAGSQALGSLRAIVGPPYSGKTHLTQIFAAELLSRGMEVMLFYHPDLSEKDIRQIEGHNGRTATGVPVTTFSEIKKSVDVAQPTVKHAIVIDHVAAYGDWNGSSAKDLDHWANMGLYVVVNGVETDHLGKAANGFPELLCLADRVDRLSSPCSICGCENATRWTRSEQVPVELIREKKRRYHFLPLCDEHFFKMFPLD